MDGEVRVRISGTELTKIIRDYLTTKGVVVEGPLVIRLASDLDEIDDDGLVAEWITCVDTLPRSKRAPLTAEPKV